MTWESAAARDEWVAHTTRLSLCGVVDVVLRSARLTLALTYPLKPTPGLNGPPIVFYGVSKPINKSWHR